MRFYIFNLRQNDGFLIFYSLFLLVRLLCLECGLVFLTCRLESNFWVWYNLRSVGFQVDGEQAISHKVLSNNAICWYIVGDDSLIDTKPPFNWCLSIAQSQNQLKHRCKIRGLCSVYVFKVKIIQQFIWSIITNENVSISWAFSCEKLWELVNNFVWKIWSYKMPHEITWCSKFFIWFLFASWALWASEFGRMQVHILMTKEFNGHLSNNFSTAEIRTFIYCILNHLTSPKEINISF